MFKNLKIIGTSHISKDSINEITNYIQNKKPDIVAVELDKKRYLSLKSDLTEKSISLSIIPQIGLTGYFFLIIGKFLQKKLGSIVGVNPGSDMKVAVDLCEQNNLSLELIDRNIDITLKRLSQEFNYKEKLTLVKDLFFGLISKKRVKFNISKVPKKEIIKKLLLELKIKYPGLYLALIDERNKFMAKKLFKLIRSNPDKKILCVIGAGHKEEMLTDLKKLYYSNISF